MKNALSATPVDCIVMPRVVIAGHGHGAAMGYKYRCRMESRQRATWFGFGPQVTEYRFVLEKHFMSWQDEFSSAWGNLSATHMAAVDLLDKIASKPSDQKGVTYISQAQQRISRAQNEITRKSPMQKEVQPIVTRHSDGEHANFTPCCGAPFIGEISHGDKCPACEEIMLWCRGCGYGEGHEYTTCDGCGSEICPDCEATLEDDDIPLDLCEDCCD